MDSSLRYSSPLSVLRTSLAFLFDSRPMLSIAWNTWMLDSSFLGQNSCFCFHLLFSGFGFPCSTFVSSILLFAVGILFDIFVFSYYSLVLVFPVQLLFRQFWFFLWGFCLTSMHAVFGEKCCLFSVFWFWTLTFCSRDCCCNMHLVFDKGMMLVGGMFPNIFMHV